MIVATTPAARDAGANAGALAKTMAGVLGGGGGGKADLAQGGGSDVAAIPAALDGACAGARPVAPCAPGARLGVDVGRARIGVARCDAGAAARDARRDGARGGRRRRRRRAHPRARRGVRGDRDRRRAIRSRSRARSTAVDRRRDRASRSGSRSRDAGAARRRAALDGERPAGAPGVGQVDAQAASHRRPSCSRYHSATRHRRGAGLGHRRPAALLDDRRRAPPCDPPPSRAAMAQIMRPPTGTRCSPATSRHGAQGEDAACSRRPASPPQRPRRSAPQGQPMTRREAREAEQRRQAVAEPEAGRAELEARPSRARAAVAAASDPTSRAREAEAARRMGLPRRPPRRRGARRGGVLLPAGADQLDHRAVHAGRRLRGRRHRRGRVHDPRRRHRLRHRENLVDEGVTASYDAFYDLLLGRRPSPSSTRAPTCWPRR